MPRQGTSKGNALALKNTGQVGNTAAAAADQMVPFKAVQGKWRGTG
jgi:hypothetical protein